MRAVSRRVTRALAAALTGLALASTSACGGGAGAAPPAVAHEGSLAAAFDDGIEAAAVGLDLDGSFDPTGDPRLRERVQLADAVVPVKVVGVSASGAEGDVVYTLRFRRGEPIVGEHPPATEFPADVAKDAAGYAVVRSLEPRLVGMSFVACVKSFATPGGDRAIHFHLLPDTPKVRRAVGDAVALGKM